MTFGWVLGENPPRAAKSVVFTTRGDFSPNTHPNVLNLFLYSWQAHLSVHSTLLPKTIGPESSESERI
jgi:hypothetical protein